MGRARLILVVVLLAGLPAAFPQAVQQQDPAANPQAEPAQNPAPSTPFGEPPLTPEQKRQKEIDAYDPLHKDEPATGQGQTRQDQPRTAEQPLPGSVAASNDPAPGSTRGPQVVADTDPLATQDYSGPAVLSRSYTIARPMTPQTIRWSPHVGYSEIFSSGLTGGVIGSDGKVASNTSLGRSFSWGIVGRHLWKHDQVGLVYSGNESRYGNFTGAGGTNQTLSADYAHTFSRKLSLNVVTSGSIYSQSYSFENPALAPGASIANVNLAASPTVQILDQGTRQLATQVSATWRYSSRLSFNGGGGVFFVQRRTQGAFGNTGYQAQGDVNYRYTRKMTVGVYYSWTTYTFSRRVNVADFHTIGGIYSYSLGRSTQFRLRAGASFLENAGLQAVPLDPTIALLIGQPSAVVEAYHRSVTSDISAQIVRDFGRRKTANISYARGVAPGNGMLLTSSQEAITFGFSSVLFRSYAVNLGGGRSTLSSAAQTAGKYTSDYASAGLSRKYEHGISAVFSLDYRTFRITNGSQIPHHQFSINTGINWGPGENFLRRF